jgi:2-keto-4-pentenoate hydratase/2-oxohepta-3-ene-1,7-dioic acid hydratase in catechol pathway
MRLISYQGEGEPRAAVVRDGQYIDLQHTDAGLPSSMKQLLALGDEGLAGARAAAEKGVAIDPAGVKLLAPIANPQKVICIGLNYADHAAESGVDPPPEPVVFCKFPSAVCAHGDAIVLPGISAKVDYEAELVAVIGIGGRDIPAEQALSHIAGYTCGHDVSARDWQLEKPGGQWLLGKTFDTFAPFGPELVTADEIDDPGRLDIALRLNGKTMQDSNTRQLIFGLPKLVQYISSICTLLPGDVIFTGTPPGVGAARKPPVFLKAGDEVEVEIEAIGTLRNPVVGA